MQNILIVYCTVGVLKSSQYLSQAVYMHVYGIDLKQLYYYFQLQPPLEE